MQQLLDHGVDPRIADRRRRAGLWHRISANVYATQPHPIDRRATLIAASLHYPHLALTGTAALELAGLPAPQSQRIDLIGPRGGRQEPFPHCVVHTSRDGVTFGQRQPDAVSSTLATVHAIAWAHTRRQAVFYATWSMQRGLATVEGLRTEIAVKPNSSIFKAAAGVIALLDEGVHSIHEFNFLTECRRRGLPEPIRQRQRTDSRGRTRYTDFEFGVRGAVIVVEIDGLGHLETEVHLDDQWRANELTLQGAQVLRIPALALRLDADPFFEQLQRALLALRQRAA